MLDVFLFLKDQNKNELVMPLKKRNVVGAEKSVLVRCLECLELRVTSTCSLMADSDSGSGLQEGRPQSVGGCLQYR